MSIHVRAGGAWREVQSVWIRVAGVWRQVQTANLMAGGVSRQFYANEVVATLDNALNVNAQALFSGDDWASSKIKRVILPAGKKAGSNAAATAAMRTGTGRGGKLILDIAGAIEGAGGAANGGVGGDALVLEQAGVTVNLVGAIKGGGGGGGKAGNGGGGYYTYTVTEGPVYDAWNVNTMRFWRSDAVVWNGTIVYPSPGPSLTSVASGGWTYHRGAQFNPEPYLDYYVSRSQPATAYTSGGVAGNGGRGQGYDGAATAGATAVAGGTNAGASGKSGDGGAFGAAGQAGANGTAGNNGGGSAGSAGGLAGFGIKNHGNADAINNTGTLLGR